MADKKESVYLTKSELVLNAIREAILFGVYEPGQKLLLKDLAAEYHMSEQPVREAIKTLQAEGLVTSSPHSGAEVARLDPVDVQEIFELRGVLEAYSATKSLNRMDDEFIRLLNEKLVLMKYYMDHEDSLSFGKINREFHILLHSKSNQLIQNMIFSCWQHTRSYFKRNPERSKTAYVEHCEIVEAIRQKDAEKVGRLLKQHLEHVNESASKVLQQEEAGRRQEDLG